jgi:hypothetical protein
MAIDTSNKTVGKVIGGAGSLYIVVKYGFLGLFFVVMGVLFVWAGCNSQFDIKVIGIGAAVLVVGIFALLPAWRAWQALKGVSRAGG